MIRVRVITIATVIFLLLTGLPLNFEETADAQTLYVSPNSPYKTISAAVAAASDGDTIYVAVGNYSESVNVNTKNLKIFGNSSVNCNVTHNYIGSSLTLDYAAVFNITASGVTVSGFNISTSGTYCYGISVRGAAVKNVNIENNNINTVHGNADGVIIYQSSYVNLTDNNIKTAGGNAYGLHVQQSNNNNFTGNTITATGSSGYGVVQMLSSNCRYVNNTIDVSLATGHGMYIAFSSSGNVLQNNTVKTASTRGIYLYWDSSGNTLDDNTINGTGTNAHGISIGYAHDNYIMNNKCNLLGAKSSAIYMVRTSGNTIINNALKTSASDASAVVLSDSVNDNDVYSNKITTANSNAYGIYIENKCNDNNLVNNTIKTSGQEGHAIYLIKNSDRNNITGNSIDVSGSFTEGIKLEVDERNNISSNKINTTKTNSRGIYLYGSMKNIIWGNEVRTASANSHGIWLTAGSHKNNLTSNTINTSSSSSNGIYITLSSQLNNLIGNTINVSGTSSEGIGIDGSAGNDINDSVIYSSNSHGIMITYAGNNHARNNEIHTYSNSNHGIYAGKSQYCDLENNEIHTTSANSYGLVLELTSYCHATNNDINTQGFESDGIVLWQSSNFNFIAHNNIAISGSDRNGILVFKSNFNELYNNTIFTTKINSSGIYLELSDDVEIIGNTINVTGVTAHGIRLNQSGSAIIDDNNIKTTNKDSHAVYFELASSAGRILNNQIVTWDSGAAGIYLEQGSNNNELENNIIITNGNKAPGFFAVNSDNTIMTGGVIFTTGNGSEGFVLINNSAAIYNATLSTPSNDFIATKNGNITAVNCSFSTVEVTKGGGGVLQVANFLQVQMYYNDSITPLADGDIEIKDNGNIIYSTAGFGGSDAQTGQNGRTEHIIIPDRWYIYINIAVENATDITVKKTADLTWQDSRPGIDMGTSHTEVFISSDIRRPPVPTGLSISRVGVTDKINITWNSNIDTVKYRLYSNKSGSWTFWKDVTHPTTWTEDGPLADGHWYFYRIEAWDAVNLNSTISATKAYYLADITGPAVPINVNGSAVVGEDRIKVTWDANADDTVKYIIWWLNPSFGWQEVGTVDHPTTDFEFSHPDLKNGTVYSFKVVAVDEADNPSADSDVINIVHRDYIAPSAPSNLKARAYSEWEIRLSWSASNSADVEGYNIYEVTGDPPSYAFIASTSALSYNHINLLENTKHVYVVTAFDEAHNPSPNSNLAENTTLAVPPGIPVLDALPQYTNIASLPISGTADANTEVRIYKNGVNIASTDSDENGSFSTVITLSEGNNSIYARARDAAQLMSDLSSTKLVKLDIQDPDANAGEDIELTLGETAYFNASLSSDNLGIAEYKWEFENGSAQIIILNGKLAEYKFSHAGSYSITLTVTDLAGNTGTDFLTVKVNAKAELERPKVLSTSPLNNQTNVPVDISVAITFSMSMNRTVMQKVLAISPPVGFDINWLTELNDEMLIAFKQVLAYNTTYTLTIGDAQSEKGGVLAGAPFKLMFTTEKGKDIGPGKKPKITITLTDVLNSDIAPGSTFTVSGTSEDIDEETTVSVGIDDDVYNSTIGADGNWSVQVTAPDKEGIYTLTVTVGELTQTLNVTIKKPVVPDEKDDEKDEEGGGQNMMLLALILVIIIVLVLVALFMMRRKKSALEGEPGAAEEEEPGEGEEETEGEEEAEADEEAGEGEEDAEDEEEAEAEDVPDEDIEGVTGEEPDAAVEPETGPEAEADEGSEELLEVDGFEEILSMPCPKCSSDIDVPMSDDPKISLKCRNCGAKGKIANRNLD